MGNVIKLQLQGMSWWMKTSLVLLLTLATTVFMSDGWYKPQGAEASVAALNAWPVTPQIVSNAATGTVTGVVAVSAGANRVMLVAIGADYTAAPATQPMTVTYGGQPVFPLAQNIGAAQTTWLGIVNEAGLAGAVGTTLSMTNGNTTNLSAMYVSAAVFSGVNQTTPISEVNTVSSNVAVTALNLPSTKVKGAAGNTALSFYITCRNLQLSTADATYTKNVDYPGTNAYLSFNTITTAPAALVITAPVATTATASTGSALVVGLVPLGITGIGAIGNCGGCHFYPGTTNPVQDGTARNVPVGEFMGDHVTHAGQYQFVCTTCHYDQTSRGNAHQNGYINLSGSRLSGNAYTLADVNHRKAISNTPSFGSCSGIYCHSDGTGATGQPGDVRAVGNPSATLTWATTKSTCNSCHTGGINAGPNYANGSPKANSHNAHRVLNNYTCNICHYATTTNGTSITSVANHVNKVYNVSPDPSKSFTYTYASTGGTCKTSTCHGGAAINLAWGANLGIYQCAKCHGDQNTNYLSNYSSASIAPGYNGVGHDTAGNTTPASPRVGTHQQHLLAQSNMSQQIHCGECHTVHTVVGDATHLNYTTATITFGPLAKTAGHTPSVSRVAGVITCSTVYCHEGTRPAGTGAGQRGTIATVWSFNGTALLDNSTVSGTCANKCHGLPPGGAIAGDSHSGLGASGTYTTFASLAACSSNAPATGCHPSINAAPTSMATIFKDKTLHVDGIVQGGSCVGCHNSSQGNRVAVAAQFTGNGNSHHYQGAAVIDGKTCYACHWEANSDGSINAAYHKKTANVELVVWNVANVRPTTYTAGVTAQQYLSGGNVATARAQIANINKNCLGCHNATNAAATPFSLGGDNSTPIKYAWDGLSVGARYADVGTTPWGKFSGNDTNAKSTQTKAFSAHGNATNNPRGWSTVADTFPSSKATANVMCFDCHNSHGSTTASVANAVTSSYSSATGRRKGGILKDTTAGKGGYTQTYEPAAGGLLANKNQYNSGAGLCFDCHNTATSGTKPWGFTDTFGFALPSGQTAGTGISGYNDTLNFGLGTFPATATYGYKASHGTNMGGHLGASSGLTTAITKRSFDPGTPSGTVIQGLCTPCHDPHGVSTTLSPNQAYGVPLLKGTWVTSPYKQDSAPANTNENRGGSNGPNSTQAVKAVGSTPIYFLDQRVLQAASIGTPNTARYWNFATSASTLQTTADTQFGGLCTGCHAKAALNSSAAATTGNWKSMTRIHNSVKGWASTGGGNAGNVKHAYTCSKCHTPHNARLPRLLVTNCLDVKHRGRVTSGGNMAASNTGGGSGSESGAGSGRFPAGGGGSDGRSSATNPGPWFFGVSNGQNRTVPAVKSCHDSATAGGSTFSTGAELWNTKSPW